MTPLRVMILLIVVNAAAGFLFYKTYNYGYERGQSKAERAILQARLAAEQRRALEIQKLKLYEHSVHEIQEQALYDLTVSGRNAAVWRKNMEKALNEDTQFGNITFPNAILRVRESGLFGIAESANRSAELSYGLFHALPTASIGS